MPSEEVYCPWCGAQPGEPCNGPAGTTSIIHKARRLNEMVESGRPGAKARLDAYLEQLKKRKQ